MQDILGAIDKVEERITRTLDFTRAQWKENLPEDGLTEFTHDLREH